MKYNAFLRIAALVVAAGVLAPVSSAPEAPIADGTEILARVNGEAITLDAYYLALGELHAESMDGEQSVSRQDPTHLLERLIRVELILQEASAIGLDELPEFTGAIESFRRDLLQAAVFDYALRDLPPPDPADVERRFAENETVLEISGVQFEKIEDAQTFHAAVGQGEDFETLAEARVADGTATEFREHDQLKRSDLAPSVVEAVADLETGHVSSPVSIGPVFAVVKLYGSRLEENPDARAEAEVEVRAANQTRALREYVENLKKEYTETDLELLDAIDFETDAAGFDEFLEDDRALVRIKEADPVRVRDLAEKLQAGLFHGVEQAAKSQRLNKDKDRLLDELTIARLIQLEGERLELDETVEFQRQVTEFEDSVLFGQFLARVLDPSVEVGEEDLKSYYAEHLADYTDPGMVRLDSLVFSDAKTAQRALEHLIAGADMAWMRVNASGLADPETVPEEMRFDRRLLIESSLAEAIRDTITGAVAGDYRLYSATADHHHVLLVIERTPAQARPFDRVRGEVERRVYPIKRQESLEDWMNRLREASEIEMLVDEEELRRLLMGEAANPADG